MSILLVLLFISYFGELFQLFSIGTYGVTVLDFLTLFVYIAFIKRIVWDGESLKIGMHSGLTFFFIIALAGFISSVNPLLSGESGQITQYFKSSLHLYFLIFFTLITAVYPIKEKDWTNIIKTWLILSIFINLFGIYQIFARAFQLPLAWLEPSNVSLAPRMVVQQYELNQLSTSFGDFFRATSVFSEPSALAGFNVIVLIFLIIPYIQKHKHFFKSQTLTIVILITSLTGIFVAFSLTGLVGLALVILSIFIFQRKTNLKNIVIIVLISILTILAVNAIVADYTGMSVLQLFSERVRGIVTQSGVVETGAQRESFFYRLENAFDSINVWLKKPVFGVGLGLYDNYSDMYLFSNYSFLSALACTGVLGFVGFVGMFVSLLKTTLKYIRKPDLNSSDTLEWQRIYGLLFYIMVYLILLHFITSNQFISIALWFQIAIVFSAVRRSLTLRNKNVYEINLVRKPLKETFNENIVKYLAGKS